MDTNLLNWLGCFVIAGLFLLIFLWFYRQEEYPINLRPYGILSLLMLSAFLFAAGSGKNATSPAQLTTSILMCLLSFVGVVLALNWLMKMAVLLSWEKDRQSRVWFVIKNKSMNAELTGGVILDRGDGLRFACFKRKNKPALVLFSNDKTHRAVKMTVKTALKIVPILR